MATSRKRPGRKEPSAPRPRSPRIKMAVENGGEQRRVVVGPARSTADVVFSLLAVAVMTVGLGGLAWRTSALVHHQRPAVLAVLAVIWLSLLFLAFVLAVQVSWRIFGKEEITLRDAMLFVEARLLGGRVRSSLPADRRLVVRLDEIPTRFKRYVYPKFRLVFAQGTDEVRTVSTLTKEEGDAALAMVRRILPG